MEEKDNEINPTTIDHLSLTQKQKGDRETGHYCSKCSKMILEKDLDVISGGFGATEYYHKECSRKQQWGFLIALLIIVLLGAIAAIVLV